MPTADGPTTDAFLAAAGAAASRWGFTPTSIEILSLSENVVCDIALADRRVVLRLHRPGYNTLDELNSEVAWVEALASSGIEVPRPLRTVDGEHYIGIDVGDQRRYVGVIEWAEGEPLEAVLEPAAGTVVAHYGRIGEIAARIRVHSKSWRPPADFTRRRWDADGLVGDEPLWGPFWQVDALTDEQRRLFAQTRADLYRTLSALSIGQDRFGLIHADLHLGNLMADGERLTVIDFDDAGYGWYAHELAVALHPVLHEPWFGEARDSLIDGYRCVHPLDDEEVHLIDIFLTVRALMLVGWLDARPELPAHAHFDELAADAERVSRRYLDRDRT